MTGVEGHERSDIHRPEESLVRISATLRKVLLFPVVLVVAYVVFQELLAGRDSAVRQAHYLAKLIAISGAFLGCAYAALGFESGAHLRHGWLAVALTYACLGIPAACNVLGIPHGPLSPVILTSNIFANLFGPYGLYFLSRTWSVAGLALPGGPWTRRAGMWLGITLGLLVGGQVIVFDAVQIFSGRDPSLIVPLVGAIGDTATFAFVAPVVLTGLALRGGLLSWPWMLLGASSLSWLLYDVSTRIPPTVPHWVDISIEALRILACSLAAAAGVAQRVLKTKTQELV